MLQAEHSAILSTFIKLPFSIKTFILYIFEWPLKTGFTVQHNSRLSLNAGQKYCSILQYFRPSLSYHFPLRPLFCLFIEWSLKTGFTVQHHSHFAALITKGVLCHHPYTVTEHTKAGQHRPSSETPFECRLVCAFVVRKPSKTGFLASRPI